jgi:hypothetical protein
MLIFSLPVPAVAQQNVREAQVDGQMVQQSTQGTGKLVVAIIDLEGRGISALEAQTLTDRMRSELV